MITLQASCGAITLPVISHTEAHARDIPGHQGPQAALRRGSVKAAPSAEPQRAAPGSPQWPGHLQRRVVLVVLPTFHTSPSPPQTCPGSSLGLRRDSHCIDKGTGAQRPHLPLPTPRSRSQVLPEQVAWPLLGKDWGTAAAGSRTHQAAGLPQNLQCLTDPGPRTFRKSTLLGWLPWTAHDGDCGFQGTLW